MRCWYFAIFALLFFACQKSDDIAPANADKEHKVSNNDNSNDQKLAEPVEVTYYLKSSGANIVDAKYNVNGKDYKACGDNKLKFTFETDEKLDLQLAGTIKNQPGNKIEARISVDGNTVAQEILEADGDKGVYAQVKVNHQIEEKGADHLN